MLSLRSGAVTAVLLIAVTGLAACTSDDPDTDAASTSTAPDVTLTRPNAPLDVAIAQVSGSLPKAERASATDAISKSVSSWIEGAYLDPAYPTTDFEAGFASWTDDAAKLAEKDGETTTNAPIGEEAVAVVADRQRVRLFVFGEKGNAGGATARIDLRLTAQRDDGTLVPTQVSGELYLTPADDGWKIFGYDLSRTGGAA